MFFVTFLELACIPLQQLTQRQGKAFQRYLLIENLCIRKIYAIQGFEIQTVYRHITYMYSCATVPTFDSKLNSLKRFRGWNAQIWEVWTNWELLSIFGSFWDFSGFWKCMRTLTFFGFFGKFSRIQAMWECLTYQTYIRFNEISDPVSNWT